MASFGETLKRERESRNISLREIAETTKINIRHLEALEADRFAALPGGVFNKGFVRAYADYLGIDAAAAVRGFLEAMSDAGVKTNADALPHAAIEPGGKQAAPHPRISMGPDPRRTETGGETSIAREAASRAARRRRVMSIAFWVVVGGALLAGPIFMRPDRHGSPPEKSTTIEPLDVPTAEAEQEAFEPPEGMFVDAGPAVLEDQGADETSVSEPPPADAMAGPPRQEGPTKAKPPPRPSDTRPASPPAASGTIVGSATPPQTRPKPVESPKPKETNRAKPAEQEQQKRSPEVISPGAAPVPALPPPGPMMLEVEVTRETWLWLSCDSNTRIDRRVRPGESTSMQCLRSIRVSAHDAGAIRLRVNGADCMPLGDDGARVYGYTIRFDDAHLICRSRRSN